MSIIFRKDPQRGFRVWSITEIFTGQTGVVTGYLYIPNVGDLVFDGSNSLLKVIAVDSISGLSTLQAINPSLSFNTDITDPDNLMHGLKSYQPHITNRIFIDSNTNPPNLNVDSVFRAYGSESTKCKLFKGSNTSSTGTVVSLKLNSSGVVVSELVDLEPVYDTNNTIKRPERFHSANPLEDGERVTLVTYSATGRVTGEHPFVVRNANMIAGPGSSNVYIEDIELISDLISRTDPELIENPLHVPFNTSMMFCRVHYSDGTKADHAIDGNKVKMHGVSSFNTSIIGPRANVVLSYYPDITEPAINLQGVVRPSLSKTYKLANRNSADEFALKLYVVPIWTGTKYRLVVRLTNLEYTSNIDVTEYVAIQKVDGTMFRGDTFGTQQHISLTLNLDNSNPGQYPGFTHVQQLKITLNRPGSQVTSDWVIDYGGDGFTYFGADKYAEASLTGNRKFKIDANISNQLDWLSWMYSAVDPAFDSEISNKAPVPTHFRLEHGNANGDRVIDTYPISDWDREFELGETRSWEQGWPLNIIWIVREGSIDKVTAISPLSIKYIYVPDGD